MNNPRLSPSHSSPPAAQSDNSTLPFVVDGYGDTSFLDFDLVSPLTSNESLPGKQHLALPTLPTSSTSQQQQHHNNRSSFSLSANNNHQASSQQIQQRLIQQQQRQAVQQQQQQQQHLQPSFPYDLYTQQTGTMPTMYSSASSASSFSDLQDIGLDMNLGLDSTGVGMDNLPATSSANDTTSDLFDMDQSTLYDVHTPAFFYTEPNGFSNVSASNSNNNSNNNNNPSTSAFATHFPRPIPSNSMPTFAGAVLGMDQVARPYAGMHQDLAMARQNELLAQQKREAEARATQEKMAAQPKSKAEMDRDEKIQLLLERIKVEPQPLPQDANGKHLPHIARLRKEEDEMDEDERLLASEEGKKLTSKERRQLRNKVSARAFRSRRKQYISELESEVEKKTSETLTLQTRVAALTSENERLANLTRTLLSTPALQPFLETYASDPDAFLAQFNPGTVGSGPGRIPKDINPTSLTTNDAPWPLEYPTPMWLGSSNQHVFAVTDIPQPDRIQDESGLAIRDDDFFNPLIADGKDAFSFLHFPTPSDGFRGPPADSKEEDLLPEDSLRSWAELLSGEGDEFDPDALPEDHDQYYVPEDLMDLYEAECGPTLPALSTSVASSPMSSRQGSVSGMDAIEEPVILTVYRGLKSESVCWRQYCGCWRVFGG
ncbi:hypothetical protein BJ508DRAFT_68626 [Ascobolus immersus RN42]|uniref:BZIP domain-containing protein n=1 Tax=Ascobolus immersus RN42 TaxID=1160509 RepID=A0A3N4HLG8_ASCIM|nr:hypothetical protein BJ508DRAFT_68626 [Ascobolus immersus RN42]